MTCNNSTWYNLLRTFYLNAKPDFNWRVEKNADLFESFNFVFCFSFALFFLLFTQKIFPDQNYVKLNAITNQLRVCSFFFFHLSETWEKVNIVHNENGTISFNQKKTFIFSEELSNGSEDDVVIVPNIPMLSATSQSKHAAR